MEPDLYYYCPDCEHERGFAPSDFKRTSGEVAFRCSCGAERVVSRRDCTTVRRTPAVAPVEAKCKTCGGHGNVPSMVFDGWDDCPACNGTGIKTPAVEVPTSTVMSDVMSMSPDEFAEHARVNTPTHDSGATVPVHRPPAVAPLNARPLSGEDLTAALKVQADLIRDRNEAVREIYSTPTHDSGATVNGTFVISVESLTVLLEDAANGSHKAIAQLADQGSAYTAFLLSEIACIAPALKAMTKERDEARAEVERHQRQWHRLVTRLEEIPPIGLRVGQPVVDREHVIRALDLDKPVPWVDESESDDDRAVYRTEEAELRAEVERLKEERVGIERALQTSHDNLDERWSELSEAHAQIAALEAVIEAQDRALGAMREHALATVALCAAYSDAGLKFGRRVADDVVVKEPKP